MIDFIATDRHYCRNPRCRSKLPSPVSNPRSAFCTKGCHSGFYRKRCLVCEGEMVRKTENQLVCGKRRCRNALQTAENLGRYMGPSAVKGASKTPDFIGSKPALASGRAWRIVAGQELSPSAFHCATVGGQEAVERINGTNLKRWLEANAKAEERCLVKRQTMPS